MTYRLETRLQHAKRGRSGFRGPDTSVMVQEIPDGIEPLTVLDPRVAKKRGSVLRYFGEGYRKHDGPKSALGKAITAAQDYIRQKEEHQ